MCVLITEPLAAVQPDFGHPWEKQLHKYMASVKRRNGLAERPRRDRERTHRKDQTLYWEREENRANKIHRDVKQVGKTANADGKEEEEEDHNDENMTC